MAKTYDPYDEDLTDEQTLDNQALLSLMGAPQPAPTTAPDMGWQGTTASKNPPMPGAEAPYDPPVSTPGNETGTPGPTDYQAPAPTTSTLASKYPTIVSAYQQYLGRVPTDAEIAAATGGGTWAVGDPRIISSISAVQFSPEAVKYSSSKTPTTPTTTPTTTTSSVKPAAVGTYFGGMEGFDQAKFNDTSHNSPKYVFARIASQFDTSTPEGRAALLAALKADPSGYFKDATLTNDILGGLTDPAFDGITSFDIFRDYGGANALQWNPVGGAGQDGGNGGSGGAGGSGFGGQGGSFSASGGFTSTPYNGITNDASNSAFLSRLQGLMGFDPASVSLDSPGLRGQSDAYKADQERARRQKQAGLAELYAAQGLGTSGALDSDIASSYDVMGQNIAGHDAQLLADEIKTQRDEMMQALAMYGGLLTDDQKNALSWKIAQMEDYISRLQVGYNYDALEGNLNNDAIRTLLGA